MGLEPSDEDPEEAEGRGCSLQTTGAAGERGLQGTGGCCQGHCLLGCASWQLHMASTGSTVWGPGHSPWGCPLSPAEGLHPLGFSELSTALGIPCHFSPPVNALYYIFSWSKLMCGFPLLIRLRLILCKMGMLEKIPILNFISCMEKKSLFFWIFWCKYSMTEVEKGTQAWTCLACSLNPTLLNLQLQEGKGHKSTGSQCGEKRTVSLCPVHMDCSRGNETSRKGIEEHFQEGFCTEKGASTSGV